MQFPETFLQLSGERFVVHYQVRAANAGEASRRVRGICLEQTVEVPAALLGQDDLRHQIVGRVESLDEMAPGVFRAAISYAIETTAFEFTQFLNVIFGNTAMQPGIRVLHLAIPDSLLQQFPGPRFGQAGLRRLVAVESRPLLCTALKPMGLGVADLAGLARQIALGGVDIIKEDHGLTDQPFARFLERVGRCAEAIEAANRQTGYRCLYVPNITAPADQLRERAYEARRLGAGGVMVAPGLAGWDAIRLLAADDQFGLPILSHPAWLGTLVLGAGQGLSHEVVFGQLPRLAGADATIFVNFGGRFPFSQQDCRGIVRGATGSLGAYPPIFPVPAGGMTLDHLPELYRFYGSQVIFLIAGGLYAYGPDLAANAAQFRRQVIDLPGSSKPRGR
jgi:ribulose-bisphosphate carboxylase large chain